VTAEKRHPQENSGFTMTCGWPLLTGC